MPNKTRMPANDGIEGEGSYSGTRAYNEATARFIVKGKVEKAAREARRAMESSEAADLERAEAKGKQRDPRKQSRPRSK